ncbi:hypothetical protein [Silanimonas sp.]|uniref:hypothetical protein n=1 Tax=Silanimonas sp. TaxID=1929290 RepID=UPI0037C623CD
MNQSKGINYFEEKVGQVEPFSLVAFGIPLSSRYGKAGELVDMLQFAEMATRDGVASLVTELFYDSKACVCEVKLVDWASAEGKASVIRVGEQTISQFTVDGDIYHRSGSC